MTHTAYYAKDGMVWKDSVETKKADGSSSYTLAFPVCKMHEAVGDEAAVNVAALLNLGDAASDLLEALKYARRFLESKDHDVAFVDAAISKVEDQSNGG